MGCSTGAILQRQTNTAHPQQHTICLVRFLEFSNQAFFTVTGHYSSFGVG
jgi:hypothetical protein